MWGECGGTRAESLGLGSFYIPLVMVKQRVISDPLFEQDPIVSWSQALVNMVCRCAYYLCSKLARGQSL